jgi:hypothetical protein
MPRFKNTKHLDSTLKLVEAFRAKEFGSYMTYSDIRDCIGYNPQQICVSSGVHDATGYQIVKRAQKILRDEYNIVIRCERGFGFRKFTSGDIVDFAPPEIAKVHNMAKRCDDELNCAQYKLLTRRQRVNKTNYLNSLTFGTGNHKDFAKYEEMKRQKEILMEEVSRMKKENDKIKKTYTTRGKSYVKKQTPADIAPKTRRSRTTG